LKNLRAILSATATTLVMGAMLLGACTEPFEAKTGDFHSTLVVDGLITDKAAPYVIKISRTGPINSTGPTPERGALVTVSDEDGASFQLIETEQGTYESQPQAFIGCVGKKYQLEIVTQEDHRYLSEWVTLKPVPTIDSVYFKRDQRLTDAGDTLDGIKILADTHDPGNQTFFYRYDWVATYHIRPYYPSYYVHDFSFNPPRLVFRDPQINSCYSSDTAQRILIAATKNLRENRVSELELNYVTTVSHRLKSKYSILVKQYALDEAGYTYWREVQKTSETLGTLFDPQPYELVGNIRNVVDADEPVLGYFDASSVAEKRIFIDRKADLRNLTYPTEPCISQLKTFSAREEGDVNKDEFNLFISWGYMVVDGEGALWAPPECADCRVYGTLEKPDFWP
jgi:hypothetical protein